MSNNEQIVTTFGVEFETCLVYTEESLLKVLNEFRIPYDSIIKGHPTPYGEKIIDSQLLDTSSSAEQCRKHYPCWTLAVAGERGATDPFDCQLPTCTGYPRVDPNDATRKQLVRKLFTEHLLVAKNCLLNLELSANVVGAIDIDLPRNPLPNSTSPGDFLTSRSTNYGSWTLTNDSSLTGCLPSQLMASVHSANETNIRNFGSQGLELISPVFRFDDIDTAFDNIDMYLNTLARGKPCYLVPYVWAGMHVHVGVASDDDEEQRLKTYESLTRHLTYTLLLHEDLISQCFPRSRSAEEIPEQPTTPEAETEDDITPEELERQYAAEDAAAAAEQARQATLTHEQKAAEHLAAEENDMRENEEMVIDFEARHTNRSNLACNSFCFAGNESIDHPLKPEAVLTIFSDPSRTTRELLERFQRGYPSQDPEHLGEYTLYRGYFYNFSNLYQHMYCSPGPNGERQKPTIEFRQHECCVDSEKVRRWVSFLEALTKKASALGKSAFEKGEQMAEFPPEIPFASMREFCGWLGLSDDDCKYWVDRWVQHNADRPSREGSDLS